MCYAGDTLDTSSTLTNYLSRTFDLYQKSKRKLVQNDKFFFFLQTSLLPFPDLPFSRPLDPGCAVYSWTGKWNGINKKSHLTLQNRQGFPARSVGL